MTFKTGPNIFLSRLYSTNDIPKNVFIANPSIASVNLAKKQKKKIIGRLDGTSYYKLSGKNLIGILKQRKPWLVPFFFWISPFPEFPMFFNKIFNRFLDRGAVWLLSNADALIFQSNLSIDMHKFFLGYDLNKIPSTIIYNGVSLEQFSPKKNTTNLEGHPKILISASEYRLHKRLQEAVQLVNYISSSYPNVKMHILGEPDKLTSNAIKDLDLSRCVFHGRLDPDDLPSLYASCDIQLSLSIFDPCPNVVCEGLASGLPVITPVQSGAYELIGEENKIWSCDEHLNLDFKTLHIANNIPKLPLHRYKKIIDDIFENLSKHKINARLRAEEELDINKVIKKYTSFINKVNK